MCRFLSGLLRLCRNLFALTAKLLCEPRFSRRVAMGRQRDPRTVRLMATTPPKKRPYGRYAAIGVAVLVLLFILKGCFFPTVAPPRYITAPVATANIEPATQRNALLTAQATLEQQKAQRLSQEAVVAQDKLALTRQSTTFAA